MHDERPHPDDDHPDADDRPGRIGRRGFIGAGLAGAGLALIGPGRALAAEPAPPTPAAPASPTPAATRTAARRATSQATQSTATPPPGPGISQLPTRGPYPNLPAVPVDPTGVAATIPKLEVRETQVTQAKQGLTNAYTIDGRTRTGYYWLYESADRAVSLEQPEQFSMGWTTMPGAYADGLPSLLEWSASLTDPDAATAQFWPMVAEHGNGYNLIVPEQVTPARARELRRAFGAGWTRAVRSAAAAGTLYAIDLRRFESLEPQTVNGAPRFTPATVTLLIRSRRTGTLTPVAVRVSGHRGAGRQVYTRAGATDGAWLYALQAAKTSITVFGIWLGHVYHWHIVTAAMQMAMRNVLPDAHPVSQLLAPQSKFVMAFDDILLQEWADIAPPTSIATAPQFLQLCEEYAAGRSFFDDDPKVTLRRLGLRQADFTDRTAWDRYPVVQRLLTIWDLVEDYVTACVTASYASDAAVAGDADLRRWIDTASSADPTTGGNVRGLPAMTDRAALTRVLTSLVYRITVHGISRLYSTSNPALTFLPNYPHCLQRTDIPSPRARLGTERLLAYLPNTGTIGEALSFYFTFTFSTPYESFIPLTGTGTELFFPGGPGSPRNRALVALRNGLASFIEAYQPDAPQRFQWPRNIET